MSFLRRNPSEYEPSYDPCQIPYPAPGQTTRTDTTNEDDYRVGTLVYDVLSRLVPRITSSPWSEETRIQEGSRAMRMLPDLSLDTLEEHARAAGAWKDDDPPLVIEIRDTHRVHLSFEQSQGIRKIRQVAMQQSIKDILAPHIASYIDLRSEDGSKAETVNEKLMKVQGIIAAADFMREEYREHAEVIFKDIKTELGNELLSHKLSRIGSHLITMIGIFGGDEETYEEDSWKFILGSSFSINFEPSDVSTMVEAVGCVRKYVEAIVIRTSDLDSDESSPDGRWNDLTKRLEQLVEGCHENDKKRAEKYLTSDCERWTELCSRLLSKVSKDWPDSTSESTSVPPIPSTTIEDVD